MEPLTPIVSTQTLHPNDDTSSVAAVEYSEAAKNYINFRRNRMIVARDTRDMPREEFDDFGFLQWFSILKKADDQYVAQRKNRQDTAINTGTIRDKNTTLVEYAQRYDFEPVALCYDQDDSMMEELAETGEDMVKKSLQLEDWKSKQKLIARAQVAFGVGMVEEQWVENWTKEKIFAKGSKMGSLDAKWTERMVKQYAGCQSKLWDLRKCYFGDVSKFFLNGPQGQPFFFTVEYVSYDVAKSFFGDWDRWNNVPSTVVYSAEQVSATWDGQGWTLRPITANYVEIIRYYDPIENEYAITLNGVDMLPIMEREATMRDGSKKTLISGFPLTEISPSGAIPFAKFDLEPMHDFAYSKPQTAKMRVWGDIENMLVKLNLGMIKQKAKPTMGNKSGKMFGPEVTDPATVISDIREGDLFPILPNFQGPTQADFTMYEMTKKELDKNSVQRSFQGIDPTNTEKTATQDMNELKAQSLAVAALFDGLEFGYRQLFWLRQFNIAKNWTKPIDVRIDVENQAIENAYRTVNVQTTTKGGQKANKSIVFSTKTPVREGGKATLADSQKVHQLEMDAKKNGMGETLITVLHPELYSTMRLSWYWSCVPVPNEADPLSYVLFAKQVNDAILMFGVDSLNVKKLKHEFAKRTGQDFDTWFLDADEAMQGTNAQGSNAAAPIVTPGGPVNSPRSMPGTLPGQPDTQPTPGNTSAYVR